MTGRLPCGLNAPGGGAKVESREVGKRENPANTIIVTLKCMYGELSEEDKKGGKDRLLRSSIAECLYRLQWYREQCSNICMPGESMEMAARRLYNERYGRYSKKPIVFYLFLDEYFLWNRKLPLYEMLVSGMLDRALVGTQTEELLKRLGYMEPEETLKGLFMKTQVGESDEVDMKVKKRVKRPSPFGLGVYMVSEQLSEVFAEVWLPRTTQGWPRLPIVVHMYFGEEPFAMAMSNPLLESEEP